MYRDVKQPEPQPAVTVPAAAPSLVGHARTMVAAAAEQLGDLVASARARMATLSSDAPPPQASGLDLPAEPSLQQQQADPHSVHTWPSKSPFLSKDPKVPTVWGNKDKDGVDPNDPFCQWKDGVMYCI